MLKSVRARLVFWHIFVTTMLVFAFGFGLYFIIAQSLYREIDLILQTKSAAIESEIDSDQVGHLVVDWEKAGLDTTFRAEIRDVNGKLLQKFRNSSNSLPFNPTMQPQALSKGMLFETIYIDTEPPLRLLTVFVKGEEKDPSIFLQVGTSLERVIITLARLRFWLLIIAPVLLILSSLGSFFLADRQLKPLQKMAHTAEQITEKNLNERLTITTREDEIGQLAGAFNRMFDRLQQAFEVQKRFVSDASHELRTPLTVLRAKLELALRKPRSSEEYKQVLQTALTQSERLSHLVEHLLLLARADAGNARSDFQSVNLSKLCLEISQEFSTLAQQKNISLKKSCADSIVVKGNEALLRHLVINLLENAIKYTSEEGTVSLRLSYESKRAKLTVSDTGIGISPEDLPYIFDRFFQVDKARSHPTSGAGLGLSIAKEIVTLHQGELLVQSAPRQGSSFTVYLPSDAFDTANLLRHSD